MAPDPDLVETINGVVARAPAWLRNDLLSKDDKVRGNAGETLATMIANAMRGHGDPE